MAALFLLLSAKQKEKMPMVFFFNLRIGERLGLEMAGLVCS